jgi:rare lipoprotein A
MTAAHRSLPFGTRVEVVRLDTGATVVVEINDRGPWVDGRIIDLAKEAARRLDLLRDGVAEVGLRVLD